MKRNPLVTACSLALVALAGSVVPPGARAQAPAPTEGQAPAAATTAPAPAAVPGGITVGGSIEAFYSYNTNRPHTRTNTFLFNSKEGQFGLNLADLRIGKAATTGSRTGFFVRLIDGDVKNSTFASNAAGESTDNILEAYGTLLVPLGGRDLKVDAGQFVTHVGYETIEVGTQNHFSRSFLFQYPTPFYNAGVRAAYPLNTRTTITGYLLNRFNGTNDPGNRDIAPGFQIASTAGTQTVVFNGLTSRENLTSSATSPNNKTQNMLDLIYTNQFSPRTKITLEGLYRFGKDSTDRSYDTYGVAAYGAFTLNSGNVLALRGEYLKQNDLTDVLGLVYPGDTTDEVSLTSVTATYELRSGLFPGSRTLLEYRFDTAGEPFFGGKRDGAFKKDQSTITVGQVYNF